LSSINSPLPSPSARIFGTDGIRGRAGEGLLTTAAVRALGRAIGDVLAERDASGESNGANGGSSKRGRRARGKVLLGHDGRRSGPELEGALGRGLRESGFEPVSAGLFTTPGLALLTRNLDFVLGVMISASHNPSEDNGIKIFDGGGEKLSDELELALEARLRARLQAARDDAAEVEADPPGAAPAVLPTDGELERVYLAYLVEKAAAGLKLDGLDLLLDCANGGSSRVAPRVLGRLGAQVHAIADQPDGDNINQDCGSTHPALLQAEVRRHGAALGIALDGDGDRCILVDERGQLVNGDMLLTLLARHAMEHCEWTDPRIVATVMSNKGLHRALREVGVGVLTVDVGDRNVVECLRRERLRLGGEQSGHIVFGPDHHFIGDGIYTALRVLRVLRETGKPLSVLVAPYRPFPQVLLNVPVTRKPSLAEIPRLVEAVRRVETELGEDGRVLLRYSGTEPLARVMVEGPDAEVIQKRAQGLADLVAAELGG
jgi:phosphoglucosamine mutase